ncbi:MAG: hypothetical protein U7127_11580 [Phormidium sp.]
MTRNFHDQFAKQYLSELLTPLGEVIVSREVMAEVRQIDVWFSPVPEPKTNQESLGLLGKMASTACLIEPFRNPPNWSEVRRCLIKLFAMQSDYQYQASEEDRSLKEEELPHLWILTPSCSENVLDAFGAKLDPQGNWPNGVYLLPVALRSGIVAINQLPATEDTLWLRLLGRKNVQKQAMNEVNTLPEDHPFKRNILEVVANWRVGLETTQNLSEDEEELLMNLSSAYVRWREDTLREGRIEGRLEGRQEGRQEMIENFLRVRFGALDDQLNRCMNSMLQLPASELSQLLLTLSREEILARFGGESNSSS